VSKDPSALRALASKQGINFGSMYQYVFRSSPYDQIFETEMNAMTATIFWADNTRKSRTEFDFTGMDYKVSWGLARGMELLGHTLVWFDELPDWLKATPSAEVETIMNEHIDTVVGRYKGKVKLWDVINEPVEEMGSKSLI
jgi:endo-1,4-beta-xylanase